MPDAARFACDAVQALIGAAAHEIRNPLNGAALNVEVVRTRSTRAGIEGAALAPFAEAAATDLGAAIALVDALLRVARPMPVAEVGGALVPVAALARAVAAARGGGLTVDLPDDLAPAVGVAGELVRGALAAALLPGAVAGATLRCAVRHEADAVVVAVESETEPVPAPAEAAAAGIAACGIALERSARVMTLRIPRQAAEAR